MPRFAANLSMLFTEVPFLERFSLAAHSGFSAVECQFPYDWGAEEILEEMQKNRLQMVLHNLPAGNWQQGERGIACLPERIQEFRNGINIAAAYAKTLGVLQLNCLSGIAPLNANHEELTSTLVSNLQYAAKALQQEGIKLLLEPINILDVPRFFVHTTQQALRILDEVGSDNLYIQFDVYHAQRMEGHLTDTLQRNLHRISHIQIADNPGRHEPGTGEINYSYLLAALDRMGYTGWVGCEYIPQKGTKAGLGWMRLMTD